LFAQSRCSSSKYAPRFANIRTIVDKCEGDMRKAIFFVKETLQFN